MPASDESPREGHSRSDSATRMEGRLKTTAGQDYLDFSGRDDNRDGCGGEERRRENGLWQGWVRTPLRMP